MIKRLSILLVVIMIMCCSLFTLSGCFVDVLDGAIELESLREQNERLLEENKELKEELATLKFSLVFPDSIVDENVILNNVNLKVEDDVNGDAIQVIGNAQVIINGGKFDGGQTPLGGAGNTSVWCNSEDAKVVINGGTFIIDGLADGDTGHIDLIYCSLGTIEINGGVFVGEDDTVWLLNCKDANYKEGKANIIVKGGTFVNFNPADCISEGEHTNFVPEGYMVVSEVVNHGQENEYTLYTVVEDEPEVEESETPDES